MIIPNIAVAGVVLVFAAISFWRASNRFGLKRTLEKVLRFVLGIPLTWMALSGARELTGFPSNGLIYPLCGCKLKPPKIPPTTNFPDFDGWRRYQIGLKGASGQGLASPTLRISTEVRRVQGSAARFPWQCDNHPRLKTSAGIFGGLSLHPRLAIFEQAGGEWMRNRIFHQARISSVTFDGVISRDGPYLSRQLNGGVALGVSGLRHFQPKSWGLRRAPPLGWWVVKYSDEERIFLQGFDRATIRALSDEFGLPVLTERGFSPSDDVRREYFFTSPAWEALRLWATRHPASPKHTRHTTPICGAGMTGRSSRPRRSLPDPLSFWFPTFPGNREARHGSTHQQTGSHRQ